MLLKKSAVAASISASISSTVSLPASITSSTCLPSTAPSPPRKTSLAVEDRWRSSRSYVTVRDEPDGPEHGLNTPSWPKTKHPTPYEIFNQAKSDPYSKKTFYQLVKLYHPDRYQFSPDLHGAIPPTTKLERYRLVVAANSILSDSSRRRAYELYGAGWAGNPEMSNASFREMDRAWRSHPGTAAHNASWEDWERWRWEQSSSRQDGLSKKAEPIYMGNGLFVATIAVFVVCGAWAQATRAEKHSMRLVEMQATKDMNIGDDIWKRKTAREGLTREGRVELFLRSREGWKSEATNDGQATKN